MTDRSLSRRKLLWAAATIGAAASTGGATAAMMTDTENVGATLTAGLLDLDPDPSWGNDDGTSISGNEGQETVTVTVSGNPSFVWFRTRCKQCSEIEEVLQVRFGLDVGADGTVDRWLEGFEDGYLTLRQARELLGEGVRLGELAPDDTWQVVVEWRTEGTITETTKVPFDFEFYATQTRHVMNADAVGPDWVCPERVCGPTGETTPTPPGGDKQISYVALCSPEGISRNDVSLELSDDGTAVKITEEPSAVSIDEVLLKYSTKLDMFPYEGGGWYATGDAPTTYEQNVGSNGGGGGDTYLNTNSVRSNSHPCGEGDNGLKFEAEEIRALEGGSD